MSSLYVVIAERRLLFHNIQLNLILRMRTWIEVRHPELYQIGKIILLKSVTKKTIQVHNTDPELAGSDRSWSRKFGGVQYLKKICRPDLFFIYIMIHNHSGYDDQDHRGVHKPSSWSSGDWKGKLILSVCICVHKGLENHGVAWHDM